MYNYNICVCNYNIYTNIDFLRYYNLLLGGFHQAKCSNNFSNATRYLTITSFFFFDPRPVEADWHSRIDMAQLTRPLRLWPVVQHRCISFHCFFGSISLLQGPTKLASHRFWWCPVASARRNVHSRSRVLRLANVPMPSELELPNNSDSESELRKSRNQLKREARRAVNWGMELASFSGPQIKRILRFLITNSIIIFNRLPLIVPN